MKTTEERQTELRHLTIAQLLQLHRDVVRMDVLPINVNRESMIHDIVKREALTVEPPKQKPR